MWLTELKEWEVKQFQAVSVNGSESIEKPGEKLPQPASANRSVCLQHICWHVEEGNMPYLASTLGLYLMYLINNISMEQPSILHFKDYQENGGRKKEVWANLAALYESNYMQLYNYWNGCGRYRPETVTPQ